MSIDFELIELLKDKKNQILRDGKISQADVLSIESLVGDKIITNDVKLTNFTSEKTNFNLNVAVEAIDRLINNPAIASYRKDLNSRAYALIRLLKEYSNFTGLLTSNPNTASSGKIVIKELDSGKFYNDDDILVPIKDIKLGKLLKMILKHSTHIAGFEDRMSSFKYEAYDNHSGKTITYNFIPHDTIRSIVESDKFKEDLTDTGLVFTYADLSIDRYGSELDILLVNLLEEYLCRVIEVDDPKIVDMVANNGFTFRTLETIANLAYIYEDKFTNYLKGLDKNLAGRSDGFMMNDYRLEQFTEEIMNKDKSIFDGISYVEAFILVYRTLGRRLNDRVDEFKHFNEIKFR